MKVLHLCKTFSKRSETFIYEHVTELERQGINSHVVTNKRINKEGRPFENVSVLPWPSLWNPLRIGYRLLQVVGVRKRPATTWWSGLEEKIVEIDPDIIHAHFGRPGVMSRSIAEKLDIPLVVTFYGYDISSLIHDERWRRAYGDLWRTASAVIGISTHVCQKMRNAGAPAEKVNKVSIGIDLDNFTYSKADVGYDGGTVNCLHVGRLVEKKAPLTLIRSVQYANTTLDSQQGVHLTVAGDGPLRGKAEKLIKNEGLEDTVSLLGAVPHEHVKSLMRKTNLYTQHCVTASDGDQEGQGVTFVEASATGRPIVSTEHNGIPDVVLDGETGILVKEGDVEGMGTAIANLAQTPERWVEMGHAGRRHVEKHFDLVRQTKKHVQIYKSILK